MAAPANERHEDAQDQDDHADDKQNFDHAMHHGRMAPHVHHKKGVRRAPDDVECTEDPKANCCNVHGPVINEALAEASRLLATSERLPD